MGAIFIEQCVLSFAFVVFCILVRNSGENYGFSAVLILESNFRAEGLVVEMILRFFCIVPMLGFLGV